MESKIVVVTGSRDWAWPDLLESVLSKEPENTVFMTGGNGSADTQVALYCERAGRPHGTIRANWRKYGNYAGPKRNGWLLDLNPRKVIAFRFGGTQSRGTTDCIKQANERGIKMDPPYEK